MKHKASKAVGAAENVYEKLPNLGFFNKLRPVERLVDKIPKPWVLGTAGILLPVVTSIAAIAFTKTNSHKKLLDKNFELKDAQKFGLFGVLAALISMNFYSLLRVRQELLYGNVTFSLLLFATDVLLNIAWPIVFFKLHYTGVSLVMAFRLLLGSIVGMVLVSRHDNLAGFLVMPHTLFVATLAIFNFLVWKEDMLVSKGSKQPTKASSSGSGSGSTETQERRYSSEPRQAAVDAKEKLRKHE